MVYCQLSPKVADGVHFPRNEKPNLSIFNELSLFRELKNILNLLIIDILDNKRE